MKQRRTIVIIGGIVAFLVLAVVALAVYYMHALEKEKNKWMTAGPRKNRWSDKAKKDATDATVEPEPETPEQNNEQPQDDQNPEGNNVPG